MDILILEPSLLENRVHLSFKGLRAFSSDRLVDQICVFPLQVSPWLCTKDQPPLMSAAEELTQKQLDMLQQWRCVVVFQVTRPHAQVHNIILTDERSRRIVKRIQQTESDVLRPEFLRWELIVGDVIAV